MILYSFLSGFSTHYITFAAHSLSESTGVEIYQFEYSVETLPPFKFPYFPHL